ncbi:MAG: alanine racemase [Candidatus Diapherotrites archaeon]|nr:alanine racemase [Candidatus Diapherotrites archaeon]
MLEDSLRTSLLALVGKNETPFFALSLEKLKQNEQEFLQTARLYFPKLRVCYSVKTNQFPEVLKALSTGFEIASLEELRLVKSKKVFKVFNGCCKKEKELEEAVRQDAIVIADSFSELEKLNAVRKKIKRKALKIGVRLNVASKFGIELSKIPEFLAKAEHCNCKVVLLHAHPGVQNSLKDYESFLKDFKAAVKLWDFEFLDFGSGFPSFPKMNSLGISLHDFLKVVKKELGTTLDDKIIVFEPGRILVADSMILVCKVCAVKELNGERIAVLDAGINVLQKIVLESFEFEPLTENLGQKRQFKLVGPLLFGNDILGTTMLNLKENDLIAVKNVGAYCASLAWEISYKKPKVFVL